MQLLTSSTAPSPQFVSLSLLVKPNAADESPASLGDPLMLASPLAIIPSALALEALQELHTQLTYMRKASSLVVANNVSKEDRVTMELLQSEESFLSNGMQIFRPLSADGIGMYYRFIGVDSGPTFSTLSALALASHPMSNSSGSGSGGGGTNNSNNNNSNNTPKVDKTQIMGVVLCVGVAGLALAHCSSSIQYTLAQRMNDCLGLLPRMSASDVTAAKGVMSSFLLLEDECRKTNEMMEARNTIVLPEAEDGVKGVMSPMRTKRKSSKSGSNDVVVPMEHTSTADAARTMMDNLTLLSVAETETFLRNYQVSGQERKANLELVGAKSRFRRRKADGRDADFDNFDYKGPARAETKPMGLRAHLKGALPEKTESDMASVAHSRSSKQLKLSKKDTKTKTGAIPALSASRNDAITGRSRRSNHGNNRLQFDDEASEATGARSIAFDGASVSSATTRVQVNIALNEDLSCSYKDSQLSTCTVEGVVQVQVKHSARTAVPFYLLLRDPASHLASLQENIKFTEDASEQLLRDNEQDIADRKFTIKVPKADSYFPVIRYKCTAELRPVPIRVQTRVKAEAGACRVALQISSNPNNSASLTDLTIIMNVPELVLGETLMTQPAGGVWDESKQSVLWCVSELGGGEKFQLQARFETVNRGVTAADLSFLVMVRCQCLFAQLSDIELELRDIPEQFPAEMTMKVARRFRLSHREKA